MVPLSSRGRRTLVAAAGFLAVALTIAAAAIASGSPTFTNTPLLQPKGDSEPALTIGADGTMAISGLRWLRPTLDDFVTNVWKGPFGSTPAYQGPIDANIAPGVVGGEDADIDLGSTGTLHATTLVALVNPPVTSARFGVSAIACPRADTSSNFANCTRQIIDTTESDRQWITSDGSRVWIAYHDSGNSTLIHVQRSDDDGFTFRRVGDPVPGQGIFTGDATFNNTAGPIVADPFTHNLYDVYAAGEPSVQKGTTANFNNIVVSRSTDGGLTWQAHLVFHAPLNTRLNNVFASLAVDPVNGDVYTVWTDTKAVFVSKSSDQGLTWSAAKAVSAAPAKTTVEPWVAARSGTVDVVYYGTTASSNLDASAIWNVYLAQSTDGGTSFAQTQVSDHSNHVGVICLNGTGCSSGTRNLLDLFEVAIDPQNRKAGIIYTDDTLTTTSSGKPLPQIVLAQQD